MTVPRNTKAGLDIVLTILKFPDLLTVAVHMIVKGITLWKDVMNILNKCKVFDQYKTYENLYTFDL